MAQHIDISKMPQKVFEKIRKAIKKDFERPRHFLKGSLRYNFEKDLSDFHKSNRNEEVYFCSRYIGKGFIYNSKRGNFEIHFDKVKRKINKIYLVA
ncbi:hypothetical protein KY314_01655 [Candidatus Woesearchaeota archaeon]|nr:hypothetical protein [Candidatus Woesearchaeota archaeon]